MASATSWTRYAIAAGLALLCPLLSQAREAWRIFCEDGNKSVVTSGISSTTKVQQSFPQCTVAVFVHGGALALIYSDNNNTPLANPFQAALDGSAIFYANDGRYDIQTTSPSTGQIFTYLDVLLCDPFAAGSVCGGASGGFHNLLSTTHLDTVPFSPPVRGDLVTAQALVSPSGVSPAWARLALGPNTYVLTSNGVDAIWAPVAAGCSPPGNDRGVMWEHPIGTCNDSLKYTWVNDTPVSSTTTGYILLAGDGTNSVPAGNGTVAFSEVSFFGDHNTSTAGGVSGLVTENFAMGSTNAFPGCDTCLALGDSNTFVAITADAWAVGSSNTLGQSFVYTLGDDNITKVGVGQEAFTIGSTNSIDSTNKGNVQTQLWAEFDGTLTMGAGTPSNTISTDVQLVGSFDTLTVNSPAGGHTNTISCVHGVGGGNSITITGGGSSDTTVQQINWLGKNNALTAGVGNSISILTVAGASNTITGPINTGGLYGNSTTLANCNHCYTIGENVSLSTTNTLAIGMSSNAGLLITNSGGSTDNVRRFPVAFASLPGCAAGTEGSFAAITDSTTATWGATITGSSTNHVMGYCDGTNWTVAAK